MGNGKRGPKKIFKQPKGGSNFIIWMFMVMGLFWLLNNSGKSVEKPTQEIGYSKFYEILKDNAQTKNARNQNIIHLDHHLD